jgi:hypothetical protein
MTDSRSRKYWKRVYAAEDRLDALAADAPDEEVAEALADYYVASGLAVSRRKTIHFSILHDARGHTRQAPHDWAPPPPPPLAYDWTHKNSIGISTTDEERARPWAIAAMLKGYVVFYQSAKACGGGSSRGTIADWRERQTERCAHARGVGRRAKN